MVLCTFNFFVISLGQHDDDAAVKDGKTLADATLRLGSGMREDVFGVSFASGTSTNVKLQCHNYNIQISETTSNTSV